MQNLGWVRIASKMEFNLISYLVKTIWFEWNLPLVIYNYEFSFIYENIKFQYL